ncbi:MAG: tRNA (adenosine(37)-N6)-threonylcarbamoyltransferase complex dimerization subunit type 1 TsaB [Phycisphaerales bacterium]
MMSADPDPRILLAIESTNPSGEGAPGCSPGVGIYLAAAGPAHGPGAGTGAAPPTNAARRAGVAGAPNEADGVRCLAHRALEPRERHDDALAPMIDAACREAGIAPGALGAIAVSLGPGGYTACRIAAATAQCIAEATGCACFGVPTARALAHAEAMSMAMAPGAAHPAGQRFAVLLAWKREDVWRQIFECQKVESPAGEPGARSVPPVFARIVPIEEARLAPIGNPLVGMPDGEDGGDPGATIVIAERGTVQRVQAHDGRIDERQVRAPRFDPRSIASLVFAEIGRSGGSGWGAVGGAGGAVLSPVDPAALQPIYPREPEAVTAWRRRHSGSP